MLELAEMIWKKIKGPDVPFRCVSDPPFEHDVQRRVPSSEKAKRVLGFEATTSSTRHARRGHPLDPREPSTRGSCDGAQPSDAVDACSTAGAAAGVTSPAGGAALAAEAAA